ncbi:hypothetical protein SCOCK_140140 [Actinacidiphila cocklensis]|uniref:Uncharacterized protein n=1 Tax=Actinacidiphila cocklensis TaxID=887465 RepID=A0A9W4DKQ2_9ACTN|nr:hypothetical protein SCOCK_140140 [Actinacidiphila cocklensis]
MDTRRVLVVTRGDPGDRQAVPEEGRRELPIEQIRELRWCGNLTAHLHNLVGYLEPGPVRERIVTWAATRQRRP